MGMEGANLRPEQPIQTPEEELAFLRERLGVIEKQLVDESESRADARDRETSQLIKEYSRQEPEAVLHEKHVLPDKDVEAVVLRLSPEEHDTQIAELLGILQEKGVRNTLSVVAKMNDPHIEDDFHRFLAEYIKEGHTARGVKEKTPLWRALTLSLLEVSLPFSGDEDVKQELKTLVSATQQLLSGFLSIASRKEARKNYFALEIAVDANSEHAVFYIAVPSDRKDLFEKQILSIFPQAELIEKLDDYNIFNEDGKTVGSVISLERSNAYPIKTYDEFEHDPLSIVLSAFAKLAHTGEGAAMQIIVQPRGDRYTKQYLGALEKIKKGTNPKEALDIPETAGGEIAKGIRTLLFSSSRKKNKNGEDDTFSPPKHVDDIATEEISKKLESSIVATNIRLLASAPTEERARNILDDLEATLKQFDNPKGNTFSFKLVSGGGKLKHLVRDFAFRLFRGDATSKLNLGEVATLFHFPGEDTESSRELKRTKAGSAPAPIGLPEEGILLGTNRYRNVETPVYFAPEDRMRHFYTIGQTGTGKTTLLKNMIVQDIRNGNGVCMIDPHGTDIVDVLSQVPPERHRDIIYFDPSYTERPMGLNMLEYNPEYPEQKTFVVNELFSIFQKLYGDVPEALGPMFEQYFRNATMLVIEDPGTGNTLFDVSRVMSEKAFRDLKLSRCRNPVVVQFWREVAEKAGGEAALANIVPYITSKFDVFLANDIMRPIVVQKESAFNFRRVMDDRKILLVNLAKGRLGDINAHLLGLIIVGKILMAALSRVDTVGNNPPDFYLYIDEFQNVTTDSIATILSEARKYRLSLNIAHQFIAQLDDKTKNAVFGNVGSMATFRVGAEDAEYLKSQFAPVFSEQDLMNVDNFSAFLKLLVGGRPVRPFNFKTAIPGKGSIAVAEQLKELSHQTYGRSRDEIEREIKSKYQM